MPINDPEAIRFVNEVVRPVCERIRALKADIDAMRAAYDGGIGDHFFNHGAEPIEDGREAEGVSRLEGNDVLAFVSLVPYSLKDFFDAPGVAPVISKPCVRFLVS